MLDVVLIAPNLTAALLLAQEDEGLNISSQVWVYLFFAGLALLNWLVNKINEWRGKKGGESELEELELEDDAIIIDDDDDVPVRARTQARVEPPPTPLQPPTPQQAPVPIARPRVPSPRRPPASVATRTHPGQRPADRDAEARLLKRQREMLAQMEARKQYQSLSAAKPMERTIHEEAALPANTIARDVRQMLRQQRTLREAIVLQEILGPPPGLREEPLPPDR